MFGSGLLEFNDALFCLTGCLLFPFALWIALMVTIRYRRWGGLAFGIVLGGATYLLAGLLFGDLVGLIAALGVFIGVIFTQQTMVVKTSNSVSEVITFSSGQNPFQSQRKPPKIEIIPPDEQDRSPF